MTKVNRIPFNTLPQEWAFDPNIGPFMRDLLDTVFQLRERSGGDTDVGSGDYLALDGLSAMTGSLDMGGNSVVDVGTVDGRDVSVDGAKLDGVESGATGDQSGAEIKALYESEANTNAFTDQNQTDLASHDTLAWMGL